MSNIDDDLLRLLDGHKPTYLHACENEGADCIDFVDQQLLGKKGRVCWCECHPWNQLSAQPLDHGDPAKGGE